MRVIRAIRFWLGRIPARIERQRAPLEDGLAPEVANPISRLLGRVHRAVANYAEKRRVSRFTIEGEMAEHRILKEIIGHSKRVLLYLILSVLLAVGIDYLFSLPLDWLRHYAWLRNTLAFPTKEGISTGLTAYIGSISALLGLIFALYAVGFQLTTDRYSEKVTSFVNNERVSTYFFRFLVFTDLFAIVVYLKLILLDTVPVFSFGLSTVLVACSLLGIIIFKNHYVEIIKPESMFGRLRDLIWDCINSVAQPGSYKQKSWSLATYARMQAQGNMRIMEALYRDLTRKDIKRGQNWTDAAFAPLTVGYLLQGYTGKKRLIDTDKPWWAAQKYEQVKASNLTMYPVKLQHEIKGTGPLFMPQNHPSWFEDRLFEFLEEITKDITNDESEQIFANLSEAYKVVLVGTEEKQVDVPPKLLPGAWQNQEFDIFARGLTAFIGLWRKVNICESKAAINYLNDYFGIVTAMIEPWDIPKALAIAEEFYHGDQLDKSKSFLKDKELPAFMRATLLDYWQRLEVEQELEGKIITEKEYLANEIKAVLEEKHAAQLDKYLKLVYDDTTEIIMKLYECQKYSTLVGFLKMQMEWISHLLYTHQNERAEVCASYVQTNVRYLLAIPVGIIDDEEIMEQVEKGYFVSLIEECRLTFAAYAHAAAITLLKNTFGQKDQDKLLREMRLPLIWGSLTYTLSELRQDGYWLVTFVKEIELMYQKGALPQLLELSLNIRQTNIYWETTRYMNWERSMLGKIARETKKVWTHGSGEIGYGEEYEHPSPFIRSLAEHDTLFEDRAQRGFVEWVKKRRAITELMEWLMQRSGNGTGV